MQVTRFVEREIVNHSNFCHPHIVQFKEVFLVKDYLAIAMEYVSGRIPVVCPSLLDLPFSQRHFRNGSERVQVVRSRTLIFCMFSLVLNHCV